MVGTISPVAVGAVGCTLLGGCRMAAEEVGFAGWLEEVFKKFY